MTLKILISPSSFGEISDEPLRSLDRAGFTYLNNPYGRKLTEDEVIALAFDCVGIIAGVEPLTAKVLAALPNLKCISRVGVGIDNIDLKYAEENHIVILNTPDGPTRAVAELTLGLTFSLLRKIPKADSNLKRRIWKKETGNLLFGKKIGIIGLGRIGRMVAEYFRLLGNEVVGYDLYPDAKWAEIKGVEALSKEEVLKNADIISIHVPGNADKTPVIDETDLKKCKKGAFLINASRGGVVDEKALFEALETNHLKAAAVDVFDSEPYTGPLCDLENVILTPHLGSYASEGKLQMEIDAVSNLINEFKK